MTPVLYPAAPFVPRGSLETGPNPLSQPWPVSVPDSPGKVAHNGSQGQPGCEWTLTVPSCANKFFFIMKTYLRQGAAELPAADFRAG